MDDTILCLCFTRQFSYSSQIVAHGIECVRTPNGRIALTEQLVTNEVFDKLVGHDEVTQPWEDRKESTLTRSALLN